jgi:hypothetical protein
VQFLADLNIETMAMPDPTTGKARFGVRVIDSRHNPVVTMGLQLWDENCTFAMLGMQCFPETFGTGYWD